MTKPEEGPGLRDLGNAVYAYLQPDGTWGWSNAGLVCDGEAALLVDTLFDLALTRRMLEAIHAAAPRAAIETVVNTHANGDHCWGNQLVEGARIVATSAGAAEMVELPPAMLAGLIRQSASAPGPLGGYLQAIFGEFEFDGISLVPPTETFDGELSLRVGDREVRLYEVGPAHTRGDLIVHVPDDRVVFAGDIVFHGVHPVIWQGPVANWVAALRAIEALAPEVIVPGHGPLADVAAVRRLADYFEQLAGEVRTRWEGKMSASECARDLADGWLASWGWGDPERIVINVHTLYREFSGDASPPDVVGLFAEMAAFAAR